MREWEEWLGTAEVVRAEEADGVGGKEEPEVQPMPWPQARRRLSWREEVSLARRMERGDQEARRQFIEANYGLVLAEANRFRGRGVPLEDLIQEGMIGLIRAVDKFDYRRGSRFSTCAVNWIRAHVRQALQDLKPLVHIPERVGRAARQVARTVEFLRQELGREPTPEEIAQRTGWPVEQVAHLLQVTDSWFSLNVPVEGDGHEDHFEDLLADSGQDRVEDRAVNQVFAEQVAKEIRQLSPREAEILRLRFGLDDGEEWSLARIGQRFNISRQRVRSIEREALAKLRRGGGLGSGPACMAAA